MTEQTTSLAKQIHGDSINYAETRTLLLSMLGLGLKTLQFGIIFWLMAATRLATLQPEPSSKALAVFLGAIPGIMLGAIPSYLVQYRDWLNQPDYPLAIRLIVQTILLGTYSLLFIHHPVTGVIFASMYIMSRLWVVSAIYTVSRI